MNHRNKLILQLFVMGIALVASYFWQKWWIILFVCMLYIAIDLLFCYLQKNRMRKIYNDIDKVLNGDYSIELADYREGEFSILQNEIHKLIIRLNEQATELKKDKTYLMDAMADISHQLKTPLTSINIIVSFLMEENLPYEERLKLTGKLNSSLRHVEWLISTLLKLSKFDADTVNFQQTEVSVQQLIKEAAAGLEVSLELKKIHFQKQIQEDAVYMGDIKWSEEAVENIIKNCMEHTPEEGIICVSALENPIYTEIVISDNGTGIDAEDIPHIFERFYRGKNADASSVGIGLALSAEIIHRQNGTIQVQNKSMGGAEFIIRFYKMLP